MQRRKDPHSLASLRDGDGASSAAAKTSDRGGGRMPPLSARGLSASMAAPAAAGSLCPGAVQAGAAVRSHSSDGPRTGASTPRTERAAQYVSSLVGARGGLAPAASCGLAGPSGALTARDGTREWTLMMEIDQAQHIQTERDRKKNDLLRRQENIAHLKVQKEEHTRAKEECRALWRSWRDDVETDVEKWKQEQEQKRQATLEVRRQFNEGCRRQLEDARIKRLVLREQEEREAREISAIAQEGLKAAQAREEQKKRAGRDEALKMAVQMKEAQTRKGAQKLEEAEYDKAMAHKQREIMDRQQATREAERQERLDKQARMLAAYEAGVGNELERRQREDEERALRQQQRLQEKEQRQQEEKEQKVFVMKEAGKKAVAEQLERQALERQLRREEELRLVQQMKELTQAAEVREKEKQRRRHEARLANAEDLRQQIQERNAVAPQQLQRDQMNEVERALNRQRLQNAQEAEVLQMLVRKKRGEYRRGGVDG